MTVQSLYTEKMIQEYILKEREAGKSFRQIRDSEIFKDGITVMDVYRGSKGIFPKKSERRLSMNLVALKPAPVCANCGELHIKRSCTHKNKTIYPPRISIRKDDMHSAAKSIINNLEWDKIEKLSDLLASSLIPKGL